MAKSIIGSHSLNGSLLTAGATLYAAPLGTVEDDTDDFRLSWYVPVDGVIRNLAVQVKDGTNTLSGAITAYIRLERNVKENVNLAATVASGADGWHEDTTNARKVYAGEKVWFAVEAAAGTGSANINGLLFEFEPDTETDCISLLGTNSSSSSNFSTASTTKYGTLTGVRTIETAESDVDVQIPLAGNIETFSVATGAWSRTTDTTAKIRVNAADPSGGPTLVLPSTSTNVHLLDDSNTATVAEDDVLSVSFTNGTGTEAGNIEKWQVSFNATSDECLLIGGSDKAGSEVNAGVSGYLSLMGSPGGSPTATEQDAEIQIPANCGGTVNKFFIELISNGVSPDSTATLRVNGANEDSITLTASTAGYYEVEPSSLTLSGGDTICAHISAGGSGTDIRVRSVGIVYEITGTGGAAGSLPLPTLVQTWLSANTNSAALVLADTINTDGTGNKFARPGNLLVCYATTYSGGDSFTDDPEWTRIESDSSGSLGFYSAWRIATGDSSDDISVSYTDGARNYLVTKEYDILDQSSPFDTSASNSEFVLGQDTMDTGAVTPSTAKSLVISMGGSANRSGWATSNDGTEITPPAGYENVAYNASGSSRPFVWSGSKFITTTSEESPRWTTTLGGLSWGATAVFKVGGAVAASPQTITIGQAAEADTAQAITAMAPQAVSIGQAIETDTGISIIPLAAQVVSVGQALETDTAQATAPIAAQIIPIGQALETDTAQSAAPSLGAGPQLVGIGQAVESDQANGIAGLPEQIVSIGQAQESDASQSVAPALGTPEQTIPIGQALETDTAAAVGASLGSGAQVVPIGQAAETDTAQQVLPATAQIIPVGQALEADTAGTVTNRPITWAEGELTLYPAATAALIIR